MYIYLITNVIDNKRYIGQTTQSMTKRWTQHKSFTKTNPQYHLHRAMRKYGVDNFNIEVIDESATNVDELNDLEELYISYYDTFNGWGYNLTSGGGNHLMAESTKEKLRQANLGKNLSTELKQRISIGVKLYYNTYGHPLIGRTLSPEHKHKLSLSNTGNTHSEESKKKISDNSARKQSVIQYDLNMQYMNTYLTLNSAESATGVKFQNISRCCRLIRPTAGGFIWRYI